MKQEGYNTRQRSEILSYLKNNAAHHLTVDDITSALSSEGSSVGKTTVYRYIDKLVNEGKVQKYFISNSKSACYEYIGDNSCCRSHYHFKCNLCGQLLHIDCDMMDEAFMHINSHHGFLVDNTKTVIYGLCEKCAKNQQ